MTDTFNPEDRRITTQAKYLAMLLPFMSKQETRYYLNGIYVTPHPADDGILLVATDGHRMGIIHDRDGSCEHGPWTCTIPKRATATLKIRPGVKNLHTKPCLAHFCGQALFITSFGFEPDDDPTSFGAHHLIGCHAGAINGTYPEWQKVVPTGIGKRTAKHLSFNPTYLADFKQVARLSGIDHPVVTIFAPDTPNGPSRILVQNVPEFAGVIMPCREEGVLDQRWLDQAITKLRKPKKQTKPKRKIATPAKKAA